MRRPSRSRKMNRFEIKILGAMRWLEQDTAYSDKLAGLGGHARNDLHSHTMCVQHGCADQHQDQEARLHAQDNGLGTYVKMVALEEVDRHAPPAVTSNLNTATTENRSKAEAKKRSRYRTRSRRTIFAADWSCATPLFGLHTRDTGRCSRVKGLAGTFNFIAHLDHLQTPATNTLT